MTDKPVKKRAPHGVTSLIVLDVLVRLHTKGGLRRAVSRVELLKAVGLSEFTVDDRLRTLMKAGRVSRVARAMYVPTPWPGQEPRRLEAPGTIKTTTGFPGGLKLEERWTRDLDRFR